MKKVKVSETSENVEKWLTVSKIKENAKEWHNFCKLSDPIYASTCDYLNYNKANILAIILSLHKMGTKIVHS